jgi:serine/threonine protein kinase
VPRFRNEIDFLLREGGRRGVLPLLDHALPDDPSQPSWYVMPLAVPLAQALGSSPELPAVVPAVGDIAETLASLAADGIAHRDIKPENLFQLDDAFLIGDFGLVQYPEQAAVTKQGRPLGPYFFMAPEMRRDADTADGELADVYSLAKTLWALAAGRPDPPPGELRRDRPELRLSTYVADPRARSLEPILERSTGHDPLLRPRMRELADELSWWARLKPVPVQLDLSSYTQEVQRLREANRAPEPEEEHLVRLWNEALGRIWSLDPWLDTVMQQSGLQKLQREGPQIEGWQVEDYGGSCVLPHWGIDTIASPWLSAALGGAHREKPVKNIRDMIAIFVLALMTPESQHTYMREIEFFTLESLRLDHIIEDFKAKIAAGLPEVIADFLTACNEAEQPSP